ncbi:hypothetical protein PAAG_06822 [Paracoccidioides lutzii Pb01]|uniref:Uncharacterized protein n=1 Tax=Paracoccidioides lutzii (strain ATCC MYA-826 / Pb01) TaxID=502779 RepID=C1H7T1_PARBA|nr:hypothetical protein PAAG_06822 [Paracoccidioides lutzii Pb01]EEH36404.2 hypothetical protein PAAG_06822 [Paracoccidioides lutzii Pb01]
MCKIYEVIIRLVSFPLASSGFLRSFRWNPPGTNLADLGIVYTPGLGGIYVEAAWAGKLALVGINAAMYRLLSATTSTPDSSTGGHKQRQQRQQRCQQQRHFCGAATKSDIDAAFALLNRHHPKTNTVAARCASFYARLPRNNLSS